MPRGIQCLSKLATRDLDRMSGWFWGGAAAGIAARRLLNQRKLSQAEQALEMETNSISAEAVAPPLAAETWFNAPGRFMFGLPQTFRYCDLKTKRWPQAIPLIAAEDGSSNSGMRQTHQETDCGPLLTAVGSQLTKWAPDPS
jgi:hypothetical protein